MAATTHTVKNDVAQTREIESGRVERALTENFSVQEHGPMTYVVGRPGHDSHLVDVELGACDCEDSFYREVVCIHLVRACVHHAFRSAGNSRLVAQVLRAVREAGCVHGNNCDGPCSPGQFPCNPCVDSTNTGHWTVWTHLVRDTGGER